jgi:hypothetical protein
MFVTSLCFDNPNADFFRDNLTGEFLGLAREKLTIVRPGRAPFIDLV